MITFLASFLVWFMFLGLIILWVIDGRFKKEQALHGFVSSLVVWVISQMIKSMLMTPRPFYLNGDLIRTITIPQDNGFPSVHTAVAFAIAITIWQHSKKTGSVFFAFAILVGIGRIMANVHFPIDVIAGAFLGLFTGYLIEKLHVFNLLKKKKTA